jgi:hypothetical protein
MKQLYDNDIHKLLYNVILSVVCIPFFASCNQRVTKSNFDSRISNSANLSDTLNHSQASNTYLSRENISAIKSKHNRAPKAEIILDSIGFNGYMFDREGQFLGIINNEIARNREPQVDFSPDVKNDNNYIQVTNKNRSYLQECLKKVGFNIPSNVLKKAIMISPNTKGNISFDTDIYTNQVAGYTYQIGVTILDKDNCWINYRLVKIYDYKSYLLRILTEKEIGENLVLSKNQSIGISTFIKSTCDAYEPDFFLEHERFSNFQTGYQFDFFPIDSILYPDYIRTQYQFMELRDSVVKYFYLNSPKFLRVVVEPYHRNIYIKEYDPKQDLDGKYKQVDFIRSLTFGKLPNGDDENHKNYRLLNH